MSYEIEDKQMFAQVERLKPEGEKRQEGESCWMKGLIIHFVFGG